MSDTDRLISLATGLSLPAHGLATSVWGALGMRGSGKSNLAAVVAEGMLRLKIPVVVLDPVGIWFSLRLGADGVSPSKFQIPVLGGAHGDIALVAGAGRLVAEALATTGSSAVLDISRFTKGERVRFAADFGEAFFEAKKRATGPVLLLLEESQRFAPQVMRFTHPDLMRCLGAFEEMAEVGRNFGIGLGLLSQRPQKINKDLLYLADTLFAFRALGILERKVIAEWVQEKGAVGRGDVKDELPGLASGHAIVWSPALFKVYGQFHLHKKKTYDAGATPDEVHAVKMQALALEALEATMATVVSEAKANDPRLLRAKVTELEKLLAAKPAATKPAPSTVTVKEVSSAADIKRTEALVDKLAIREEAFLLGAREMLRHELDKLSQAQQAVVSECGNLKTVLERRRPPDAQPPKPPTNAPYRHKVWTPDDRPLTGVKPITAERATRLEGPLSKRERALLTPIAVRGKASDSQIAALSNPPYSVTSSSFKNGIGDLRARGYITGDKHERVATAAGMEAIGPVEVPPTGPALFGYWMERLSKREKALLTVVFREKRVSREDLAALAEPPYSTTSSSFKNGIGDLRRLSLITTSPGGDVVLADVFTE